MRKQKKLKSSYTMSFTQRVKGSKHKGSLLLPDKNRKRFFKTMRSKKDRKNVKFVKLLPNLKQSK